jgi:hypothetical protein
LSSQTKLGVDKFAAIPILPRAMAKTNLITHNRPHELGYSMPAEWEKHSATWLGWPHNESDWPDKIDTIRWVYGEMVRKISQGEMVRILVRSKAEAKFAASYLKRAACDLKRVQFVVHPTNRGWTRDSGPIHVKRSPRSNVQGPSRSWPSCISISTRGPSTRTGSSIRKCPRRRRRF